jgi:hypothetical protein
MTTDHVQSAFIHLTLLLIQSCIYQYCVAFRVLFCYSYRYFSLAGAVHALNEVISLNKH